MILRADCRHFPGDRPCTFNKTEGVVCDDCPHYERPGMRILVIKLDAVGDVLRTTCILPGLRERYAAPEITWVTRSSALDLFRNNKLVDRVLAYESTEAVLRCAVEEFDLIINLDTSADSAVLASHVKGKEKLGYGLDSKGNVFPFNPEATRWLEMGAFDRDKKANTQSYQDLMLEICRLHPKDKRIVLNLSPDELVFADGFSRKRKLPRGRVRVGMNTGSSPRWQYKQWTMEGFRGLIRLILRKTDWTILLYGGPHEARRNAALRKLHAKRVIDTGTDNSLREFFSLLTLSDVFLTGDTLALHAATALKKKVVAYFGPTSSAEIDSYGGQILKVHSDLDCLCCYKTRCDFDPHCMNSMTPEFMFGHLQTAVASLSAENLAR